MCMPQNESEGGVYVWGNQMELYMTSSEGFRRRMMLPLKTEEDLCETSANGPWKCSDSRRKKVQIQRAFTVLESCFRTVQTLRLESEDPRLASIWLATIFKEVCKIQFTGWLSISIRTKSLIGNYLPWNKKTSTFEELNLWKPKIWLYGRSDQRGSDSTPTVTKIFLDTVSFNQNWWRPISDWRAILWRPIQRLVWGWRSIKEDPWCYYW